MKSKLARARLRASGNMKAAAPAQAPAPNSADTKDNNKTKEFAKKQVKETKDAASKKLEAELFFTSTLHAMIVEEREFFYATWACNEPEEKLEFKSTFHAMIVDYKEEIIARQRRTIKKLKARRSEDAQCLKILKSQLHSALYSLDEAQHSKQTLLKWQKENLAVADLKNRVVAEKQIRTMRKMRWQNMKILQNQKELEERKEHAKKKEEELKRVKDENQRECVVCMDDCDLSDGVECHSDERHFLCKPCLSLQVHNSVENDNLPTFEKNNCRIQCAAFCGQAYSDHSIAQRVSEECFSALLEAKTEIKERVLAADLEKGVEQRIEAQVAAIAAMSDAEKRLRRHRKHVIERILTLACPRCSRAFVGFEGCFALKCSAWVQGDPNSCCQFCAYCLKDCGRDAHPHVRERNCPGNQGVFQPMEVFEATHRLRRGRLLKEYLADMNDEVERQELIDNLARELMDLDLDPQMFLE